MESDLTRQIANPHAPLTGRLPIRSLAPDATGNDNATKGLPRTAFANVLAEAEQAHLHWSAHAQSRLATRGVTLTTGDMNRLHEAVAAAARKGARDAYVCYGDIGFVVNVPHHTVVTALLHQGETVVTQIDSVVVIQGGRTVTGAAAAGTDRTAAVNFGKE